jgi:hypothetical protein
MIRAPWWVRANPTAQGSDLGDLYRRAIAFYDLAQRFIVENGG